MSIGNDLSDIPRIQQKRESSRGWWTGETDVEAVGIVAVDIEVEAVAAGTFLLFFLLPAIFVPILLGRYKVGRTGALLITPKSSRSMSPMDKSVMINQSKYRQTNLQCPWDNIFKLSILIVKSHHGI